jgi:hypothetical protein
LLSASTPNELLMPRKIEKVRPTQRNHRLTSGYGSASVAASSCLHEALKPRWKKLSTSSLPMVY